MCLHISAGHAVTLVDVGKRVVAAEGITVDDALDQTANVQEADLVAQEVRNGGLVRTVGGAGSQTALADSLLQALRQRKVSSSAVAMLSLVSAVKSSSGTGLGRRSGQVSAYWMGMRMSGTPSCAMIE